MSEYYDIDGQPIEMMEWARKFEDRESRRIGADEVGEASVSTVYLGLNHRFGPGRPLIFETMIFGGPHSEWQARYSTRAEAAEGHRLVVEALRAGEHPDGLNL